MLAERDTAIISEEPEEVIESNGAAELRQNGVVRGAEVIEAASEGEDGLEEDIDSLLHVEYPALAPRHQLARCKSLISLLILG